MTSPAEVRDGGSNNVISLREVPSQDEEVPERQKHFGEFSRYIIKLAMAGGVAVGVVLFARCQAEDAIQSARQQAEEVIDGPSAQLRKLNRRAEELSLKAAEIQTPVEEGADDLEALRSFADRLEKFPGNIGDFGVGLNGQQATTSQPSGSSPESTGGAPTSTTIPPG